MRQSLIDKIWERLQALPMGPFITWHPHYDFVQASPYIMVAGPQARIVPTTREVLLRMDQIIASFLPGSIPGETVSNYIARFRASTSGMPVSIEKTQFHREFAIEVGRALSPVMGVSAITIATGVFRFLEG